MYGIKDLGHRYKDTYINTCWTQGTGRERGGGKDRAPSPTLLTRILLVIKWRKLLLVLHRQTRTHIHCHIVVGLSGDVHSSVTHFCSSDTGRSQTCTWGREENTYTVAAVLVARGPLDSVSGTSGTVPMYRIKKLSSVSQSRITERYNKDIYTHMYVCMYVWKPSMSRYGRTRISHTNYIH